MTSSAIPKMFDTRRCIEGWEVISADSGHQVTKPRSQRSAVGICNKLNQLHASGDRKAFARALGTYD
jgi:hypothetical protein